MRSVSFSKWFIIAFLVSLVLWLVNCTNDKKADTGIDPIVSDKQESFAGSESCTGCHQEIVESHRHTAHFQTSQPASEENIMGSFEKGQNRYAFSSKVYISMDKKDSGYYQTAYQDGAETKHRRFDIIMGSGKKGQTFAYWWNNNLYQLPISYFTTLNQWTNSPGFPNRIVFNRPITSRCLECHSTYARTISAAGKEPEEYQQSSMIFGIDCEKCHGPAKEHISYHQQHPLDTIGKHLINPANFSRQQKLDLCALCHGGRLNKTQPSFSFQAGDKLTDYFYLDTIGRRTADIDVHGNQFGLLSASKCFTRSDMTCESCHDPHKNETGQFEVFSSRCLSCHNSKHDLICKLTKRIGPVIEKNCIDCHMPDQPSKAIAFLLQGNPIPASANMRTHLVKVYPELTEQVISNIKEIMNHP